MVLHNHFDAIKSQTYRPGIRERERELDRGRKNVKYDQTIKPAKFLARTHTQSERVKGSGEVANKLKI